MSNNRDYNPKKSIMKVLYIFLGLFVLTMGYFMYFLIFRSNEVINSTYNKRHDVLAERVIRGMIISADQEILAHTIIDEQDREIRRYPFEDLFAHVVGKMQKGMSGLEETENIRLMTSNRNSFENLYNEMVGQKNPGNNIYITMDTKLQQVAYDALGDHRGAVVVMEPGTGKILTMVSKPSFDPNEIDVLWPEIMEDVEEESPLMNRATQGLYPPGSTFKLLTALAFMRDNPDYITYEYDCNGSVEYENMKIHCYKGKAHGEVDLIKSFAKSCNTSFATIGKDLSTDSLYSLSETFLFNQYLPIRMANSPSSFVLKTGSYSVKEAMQTAIGQGRTLVTPIHNVMIAAAVANGGVMMKPYVVDRIVSADGYTVKEYEPEVYANPMTKEEAEYLGEMMQSVVTVGTADELKDGKVTVAGKTGSADQAGKPAHAWFIGYAPADKPQIAFSILVESVGTGGDYAVPIARQIIDAYFN
ncbi:penicillin-binding protein 2 [Mobilitalea sibirica]|uniref:Penicillin-binding protein 2 n=1 Tax=Mobilitalea sibirica TaxID=1462919 RepID=A0A8J7KVZ3_9FIRM|nr:penicillin-binding protein 2 [Mobilitalea sibirica]